MGQSYIVEFHAYPNNACATYDFRVFDDPLGGHEDVSIPGGQPHVSTHLVPPVDGIPASNDPVYFGASIQQRNTEADQAGWYFYAAEILPQNEGLAHRSCGAGSSAPTHETRAAGSFRNTGPGECRARLRQIM